MKAISNFFKKLLAPNNKKAFCLKVKCSECGEEVSVRINRSSDFQMEYNPQNPAHLYTIKREIMGKCCFNLMHVTLALTKDAALLFNDSGGCKFISFEMESGCATSKD